MFCWKLWICTHTQINCVRNHLYIFWPYSSIKKRKFQQNASYWNEELSYVSMKIAKVVFFLAIVSETCTLAPLVTVLM